MKKKIYIFQILIIFFLIGQSYAQNPTYIMRATNFQHPAPNQLEFDVYVQDTNPPVYFELAGIQLFFNFNPAIGNGGILTYQLIGSDLPGSMQPRGPTVSGNQLRLGSGSLPGAGNGYNMTNNGYPGTLIVRMRLSTNAASFLNVPLNLQWRNQGGGNPYTKINAYVGTSNTEITDSLHHFISSNPELINPPFNSLNNNLIINFKWTSTSETVAYNLQVSTDSTFNSSIIYDSTTADTSKTVGGFAYQTRYFWRVISYNQYSQALYSSVWSFNTLLIPTIRVNLKITMEGIYYPLFHQLARKDTVALYLRDAASPYAIRDSARQPIDSISLSGLFTFYNLPSGAYYLDSKHFNTVEVWSKSGGEQLTANGIVYNYDFTVSAAQAFGNNLKLKGDKYSMYSGDVNQDGIIDLSDYQIIDNNVYNFTTGLRIPADLNADNIVELADMQIAENNHHYIGVITP
jgi:hypothetical protein